MWYRNRTQTPPYNPGSTAPQQAPQEQTPQQFHPQRPPRHTTPAPAPVQAPHPVTPAAPAPATNPNAQQNTGHQQAQNFAVPQEEYIDSKISKLNAKNKVMDFSDALVKANPKDYANIHGVGGKGHAPNSGINLTLCDYSKGKGENSVTVKFNIDVQQVARLLSAVEAAGIGVLGLKEQLKGTQQFATANGVLIGWLQSGHQPTIQELAGLQQTVCNGLMAQDPENIGDKVLWCWDVQKNNPYPSACKQINGKEHTPVSTVSFAYNPSRNYAWTIRVANYWAPIIRQQNGASSHNNKEATEKREVVFPVTTEALYCALTDVKHYIRLWEYRMFRTVDAMCNERERRAEAKRQQNQNK